MATMADIMRSYGQAYIAKYENDILPSHRRTINDIIRCRTKALGGHVYECPDHHEFDYKYHSCMNRHCPQCQNDQATQWLSNEQQRLINVPYFLVGFTLPEELRPFARSNQKLFYNLLFSESWRAMAKLAQNPKWLGGLIGALGVLHTWTKVMGQHPHVHYLVPAGAVSNDKKTWIRPQKKFFLPVKGKGLSKVFRAMLRDALKQQAPKLFQQIPPSVWRKKWVVHCKPVGNGYAVLKYFVPYIFRVAISNKRIVNLENDQVTFAYKDTHTRQWKTMKLPVFQFIRRFLQHVLPKGFKKVRHFGYLSSRNKQLLSVLQYIFGTVETEPVDQPDPESKVPHCSVCGKPMILIEIVRPGGFDERWEIPQPATHQARAP
jgi:hypothetical protein